VLVRKLLKMVTFVTESEVFRTNGSNRVNWLYLL
jgi:hypothetical protein